MGTNPNKYHISDDGKVYRINEDGSFTSLGNIENQAKKPKVQPSSSLQNESGHTSTSGVAKFFKGLLSVVGTILVISALVMEYDGYMYIQCFGCILCLLSLAIKTKK